MFAALLDRQVSELSAEIGVGKARVSTFCLKSLEVPASTVILIHFCVNKFLMINPNKVDAHLKANPEM